MFEQQQNTGESASLAKKCANVVAQQTNIHAYCRHLQKWSILGPVT